MKVRKDYLILIAGIVWLIAGVNIFRIALEAGHGVWHFASIVVAVIVFALFFFFIFGRMVEKHTDRIMGYESHKVWVFHFFDTKSYIIMAFMITLGIVVRALNLLPDHYIAMFYAGLGSALLAAGVAFITNFAQVQLGTFSNKDK